MARLAPQGGQYQPLNEDQIEQIHRASLRVLEQTGLNVDHDKVREIYRQGGAKVDNNRVYIPAEMVEKALETVPSKVLLAGRAAQHDLLLAGRHVYIGTGGSPTTVLDPGSNEVRPGTIKDLVDLVKLADALEYCNFIVIPLHPTDIPEEDTPVNRFYACLANSTKHIMGGVGSVEGARQVIEMGKIIAGGLEQLQRRPFISAITCWMLSPLQVDSKVADILIEWCKHGLPVALSSAPMAGSTAPVTLAGSLVQLNAEQLSGIVLTQLIRPGTPILAGYIPGVADMRTGGYLGGAVEFGMMQAGAAQLAHFYSVPIYCSGGMTDSKSPDAQSGYEKMATLMLAAMGGSNFIHHAIGMITNMNSASLEQAVVDEEIVGMVMRVLRGINVTDESLAVETIHRVGPGGHYLMEKHTKQHMRPEFFQPALADHQAREMWESSGKQDARARATARVKQLLRKHDSPGLPEEIDAVLRAKFNIHLL